MVAVEMVRLISYLIIIPVCTILGLDGMNLH